MNSRYPSVLAAALISVVGVTSLTAADSSAQTAEGYWEGAISLPTQALAIQVELAPTANSTWQGTIDIPMQGLRGFKLNVSKVDGSAVEFALPGIPGDPSFSGKLAADAKTISGDFFQNGAQLPFNLERKAQRAPRPVVEPTPERGVPGAGLAGNWRGSIKPIPALELRLALELSAASDGTISGVLVSLDQGAARIPISSLTEANGKVHIETPAVRGVFDGKMNDDGSEIAGTWSQNGQATPLVFKRLASEKSP